MAAFQAGPASQVGSGMPPADYRAPAAPGGFSGPAPAPAAPPSFLDDWLAKRQQIASAPKAPAVPAPKPVEQAPKPVEPTQPVQPKETPIEKPAQQPEPAQPVETSVPPVEQPEKLHIRDNGANTGDDGMSIKLR